MNHWAIDNLRVIKGILINTCRNLSEDKRTILILGPWTPQDILAHLIEWDKATMKIIQEKEKGILITWLDDEKIDEFNAAAVLFWQGKSFEEVITAFQKVSVLMILAYGGVPEHLWEDPLLPGHEETIAKQVLIDLAHHTEHLNQILQSLF